MTNKSPITVTPLRELPKSSDLTQVYIYGLSFLSAGLFLFYIKSAGVTSICLGLDDLIRSIGN